jgi:ABC-2 type transport system ATP-binding protein
MSPILEVKNLGKSFGDFALKDISFSLDRGYIMGFIGPNGAGKSSTIKLIMNLMNRDTGQINVFGLDNLKHEQKIKNKIGFVYDENVFYEQLTIDEMKRIITPFYRGWDERAFQNYLKEFDLSPRKKIKNLSKGMKMKFSLAIALAHQADLLIMDEPTSGLDPVVRGELLEILTWIIQDENKGIFFSTHITTDLDKIADYVTLIDQGQIVFSCAKDELIDNYGLVKGSKGVLEEHIRKEFIGIKENNFGFEGLVSDKKRIQKILNQQVVVEKPSLEDLLVYHTRRN